MTRPTALSTILFVGGLLLLPGFIAAQERSRPDRASRAAIRGTVRLEEEGSVVAGAVVVLEGTPLSAITDRGGEYVIDGFPPGTYTVRVVAGGFVEGASRRVEVAAGEIRRVDFELGRTIVPLPGVVVTASRGMARPGEAPVSVAVVDGEEIRARQVITVDEALRFAPGVIFNAGQLDIRGSTGLARGVGSRSLVLLDGERVLSGTTGAINFDILPVLDVERIEVVKGPHSTLYGSSALGGVVNLITEPISREPETRLRLHWGAYDIPSRHQFASERLNFQGVDLERSQHLGNTGLRLTLGRKTSDGFRQNGDYDRWYVRGKVLYPAGESAPLLDAQFLWARKDEGEFFTWRSPDRPLEVDPPEAVGDWDRADRISASVALTPIATAAALVRIRTSFFRHDVQNHFHDNQDHHRSNRVGTDVQVSLNPGGQHTVVLGLEGAWTGVEANILGTPTLVDLGAYAQEELRITDRIRGTAGIRLDYHAPDPGESEAVISPKLGLVYRASERIAARLSLSRGYRAPSAVERYTSTTVQGFRVVPNPELEGETAWSGEVGVTATVGQRFWLDAGFFHTEYDDLIEPAGVPDQIFTFQFRNVADARVRGFDLGARVGLLDDRLGFETSYTYLDTEDRERSRPLPYRSAHNVTSTLSAGFAALDLRYRSRVERVLSFPLDPRDPITVVDLRLAHELLGVQLQAKVANLLNNEYVNVQERNLGPLRHFQVTAATSF